MTSAYIEFSCIENATFYENLVAGELKVLLCLESWKNKEEIMKITKVHNEVMKTVYDFNDNNVGKALLEFDVKMKVCFHLLEKC